MMSSKRSEGENYPSDQSHLLGSLVSFNLVRLFHEELVYLKLKLISKLTPTHIFNLLFSPQHLNFEIQILLIFYQKEAIKNQNDTVKMKGYSVSNPYITVN